MNRRHFILSGTALALGCARAAPAAPDFAPTRFSVEVRGSGPDVILIPGLASGRGIWADLIGAVPGHRYHLIHVHGFAGAPAAANRRGAIVSPLADEVARYIQERRLRRPALIGHSLGGIVAMMVGARHPDRVGRIMVVDILPEPARMIGASAAGAGALANSLLSSASGRRLVGSLMSNFSPPDSSLRTSDADVVARTMNELAAIDLTPALPRIRAPMTIAYASWDGRAAAALDRTFARAYAGARSARFVRIDGSGHMVMIDQPVRFAAAVRAFLTR